MKIAIIAHIRHAIAEPFMGGMESHGHALVRALEQRGHAITLFAAKGSDAPCLEAICPAPYEAIYPWAVWRGTPALDAYQRAAFASAWQRVRTGGFDVVHNNSLFPELIAWASRDGQAMVSSQHVPPFARLKQAVSAAFGDDRQQFTVTSHQQRALWTQGAASNLHVVHNGIDLAVWPDSARRGNRLLWFGRITPNKGLREAVAAAAQADVPLDIIGAIEDAEYHAEFVVPALGSAIRYLGHLSGAALRNHVAAARAVVVTPMWDEPFGLVAAEALACGVPVIAFDRGAMREVVGDCGAIVPAGDVAALAAAMLEDYGTVAHRCRTRIEALFSVDRMIDRYERCYRRAISAAADFPAPEPAEASASSCASTAALLA